MPLSVLSKVLFSVVSGILGYCRESYHMACVEITVLISWSERSFVDGTYLKQEEHMLK